MPSWIKRFFQKKAIRKKLNANREKRAAATYELNRTGRLVNGKPVELIWDRRAQKYQGIGPKAARKAAQDFMDRINASTWPIPTINHISGIEDLARGSEADELNRRRPKGKRSPYKLTGLQRKLKKK